MRLADYVVSFLEERGVRHVFMVSGGGAMFLCDALGNAKKLRYVCNHHEQACAMAAEGYSRLSGEIGVAFVTTGPGGTNAITGVAGAWLDSIPMLIISGQVRTEFILEPGMRQIGDQEINIIDLVKPLTKYAVLITDPQEIRYHLEKAFWLAMSGRRGPVWLDIPLDVQSAEIDPSSLQGFDPPADRPDPVLEGQIINIVDRLLKAERPILVVGNGIRLAGGEKVLLSLLDMLKIPVGVSINGIDLVTSDYPYLVGRFGVKGGRAGNFAVQNSDMLISIGCRMILQQTGFNYKAFAREAYQVYVDIDPLEMSKKTVHPDMKVVCDARIFIELLADEFKRKKTGLVNIGAWRERCVGWVIKYPEIIPAFKEQKNLVNSYFFTDVLCQKLGAETPIITSNGTANVCTLQCAKLKKGQRMFTNTGLASMGYGLPAALGAAFANKMRPVVCIEGDGSLQMNIQELQTLVHYRVPVKLFVINNNGYLSIKLTQDGFFGGHYVGSGPTSGVTMPDLEKVANAYGIPFVRISDHSEVSPKIDQVLAIKGAVIAEVMMDPNQQLLPKVVSVRNADGKLVSKPIEDMTPLLPREEFKANMIIQTMEE